MPKVGVHCYRCIQDSQEYGTSTEYMVSRVIFTIHYQGKSSPDMEVLVKQPVGSNYETAALEVFLPPGKKSPLDLLPYAPFREQVERYYRRCVGSTASGIRIPGAKNIRMRDNTFETPYDFEFDAHLESPAW